MSSYERLSQGRTLFSSSTVSWLKARIPSTERLVRLGRVELIDGHAILCERGDPSVREPILHVKRAKARQHRLTHRAIHPSPIPKAPKKPVTARLPHEANNLLQRPQLNHDDADLLLLRRHLRLQVAHSVPAGRSPVPAYRVAHLCLQVAELPALCLDDFKARRPVRFDHLAVDAERIDLGP